MDLRGQEIKNTYGNVVTVGSSAGAPTTGELTNGQNTSFTSTYLGGNFGIGSAPTAYGSLNVLGIGSAASAGGAIIDIVGTSGRLASIYTESSGKLVLTADPTNAQTSSALEFNVDGSNAMFIDSSQRVGIGTTSPSNLLTVSGTGYIFNLSGGGSSRIAGAVNNTSGNLEFGLEGSVGNQLFNGAAAYDAAIGTSVNKPLHFATDTTVKATITSDGNVGIGTTSPSQTLHVSGSARITGAIYDSNNAAGTSGQVLSSTGTGTDWVSLSEISGVDGTGTANYVAKWSDTDTITNSQLFDNGTNVGIGTTSPATTLHIANASNAVVRAEGTATSGESTFQLLGKNSSGTARSAIFKYDNSDLLRIGISQAVDMRFETADTERMRITSAGNVGIGNSIPSSFLSNGNQLVVGSGAAAQGITIYSNTAGTGNLFFADGTAGDAAYRGFLRYDHALDAMLIYTAGANERMIITSAGNVGIGTSTPTATLNIKSTASNNSDNLAQVLTNSEFRLQYRADDISSLYIGGLGSERGYLQGVNAAQNAGADISLNPYGGNVGIGTNSPEALLHVNKSTAGGEGGFIYIDNPAASTLGNSAGIKFATSGGGSFATTPTGSITNIVTNASTGASDITFGTFNGVSVGERVRIDSAGNVGIGTNSPNYSLQVNSATTTTRLQITNTTTGTSSAQGLQIIQDGNNTTLSLKPSGFMSFETANAERMRIISTGDVWLKGASTSTGYEASFENTNADFRIFGSRYGGTGKNIQFWPTGASEAMRITSAGNVGIGTSSPVEILHILGNQRISAVSGYSQPAILDLHGNNSNTYGGSNVSRSRIASYTEGGPYNASMRFYTNDSANALQERMRIDSTGNVGIGTSSPAAKLDVALPSDGTAGVIFGYTGGSNNPRLFFNVNESTSKGQIIMSGSSGALDFGLGAGGAEIITLKGSGNVGIGTSAPDSNLHIKNTSSNAKLTIETADAYDAYINFSAASGEWSMGYDRTSDDLIFCAGDNLTTNERIRFTSDGLTFNGDTAAANALDDYEEGTFTPTIEGTSTAGTGTYTTQFGQYTKIGNMIYFRLFVAWTAHTGTGDLQLGGLPFTANATRTAPCSSWVSQIAYTTVPNFTVSNGTTKITALEQVNDNFSTGLPMDASGNITISGTYHA